MSSHGNRRRRKICRLICVAVSFKFWIEVLKGEIKVQYKKDTTSYENIIVDLNPSGIGELEFFIDEFQTAWEPGERLSFDDSCKECKADWEEFLSHMPPVPTRMQAPGNKLVLSFGRQWYLLIKV